ncbi:hypothetical protein [Desulfobacca acetoxidans]|uniref:Uncharacterized protein n=1 Tax=Desulfobacca acetoxidans (strain ATCC 700848 / DSM 11109 / ASRB2) TaxID=880072 RepID=F2ND90_DESAR|nr:hypothetical protein [Desulfobacca acetoxidans]AEB09814.1 hypothetical protein Desac_1982 [Desulfobacca acetoxidans DSM 11109]
MHIYKSNLEQSEDENGLDSPIILVTDPSALLDTRGIRSCFKNPEEESQIDKIDENFDRLAEQTVNIGEFSSPIIKFPSISHRRNHMVSLQKWQGYVLIVTDNSLLVRLVDLSKNGGDEEAEIPIEEISDDDKDLIRPGAIFYWSIGYLDSYSGQRSRVSVIRFQRLPSWSKEEIDAAKREAEHLQEAITWK